MEKAKNNQNPKKGIFREGKLKANQQKTKPSVDKSNVVSPPPAKPKK